MNAPKLYLRSFEITFPSVQPGLYFGLYNQSESTVLPVEESVVDDLDVSLITNFFKLISR